ncbi:MAG: hypothetical protein R3Y32_04600 [Bacillota bacterium]
MVAKSNAYIDRIGVNILKTYLLDCPCFDTLDIEEGGNKLIWDGSIGLKATHSDSAEGYRRVPIQVKSTTRQMRGKHNIEKRYLEAFRTEGYGLFIVIEVEMKKIWYRFLFKKEIDNVLNKINKSKSFDFEQVPHNAVDFYKLCKIQSMRREELIGHEEVTIEEMHKYTSADLFCVDEIKQPVDFIDKNVFLKLKGDNSHDVITEINKIYNVIKFEQAGFDFNGKQYYLGMTRSIFANKEIINIGKSLILELSDGKIDFIINDKGNVYESVIEYEFAHDILSKCKIEDQTAYRDVADKIKIHINFLKQVCEIVEKVGLNKSEIYFSKMTEQEKLIISQIISGEANVNAAFGYLPIAEKNALILSKKENGRIVLESVFKSDFKIMMASNIDDPDYRIYSTSPLTASIADVLVKIDNFEKKAFVDALIFAKIVPQDNREIVINNVVLELINAFDIKENRDYLEAALEILNHLKEDSNIYLNKLQIYKRMDCIKIYQKEKLVELKEESESIEIKWACSVLLDNKIDSKYWYNKIENKEIFKGYPIYTLYLKLIN